MQIYNFVWEDAELPEELSQEEKPTEFTTIEPVAPTVPVKVLSELDDCSEGYIGAAAARGDKGIFLNKQKNK